MHSEILALIEAIMELNMGINNIWLDLENFPRLVPYNWRPKK